MSRPDSQRTVCCSGQRFIYLFVLVLSVFYTLQKGSMIYFGEIYTFPRIKRGSNIIRGDSTFQGVQLFPGGNQFANFYRNPYNL